MADTWSERIAWLIKTYAGDSPSELARMIETASGRTTTRQNVESWKGGSAPKLPSVEAVLVAFPELRPEWVVLGVRPRERLHRDMSRAAQEAIADAHARILELADRLADDYGLDVEPQATASAEDTERARRAGERTRALATEHRGEQGGGRQHA